MEKIDWLYTQTNSDKILTEGLFKLKETKAIRPNEVSYSSFGNYLISYLEKPYYIGEAKDIKARLKQQFKPTTSTFYKNFQKILKSDQGLKPIPIDNFSVQFISTKIGRKEIEDFGIVNLPTQLNKFQIGKRQKIDLIRMRGLWDKVQELKNEVLQQAENEVLNQIFMPWFDNIVKSTAGLYVVKKMEEMIYIGESSDIKERHTTHSTTTYFSALRRHIATDILDFELKERNGKKKYLSDTENASVTDYLSRTTATFYPVSFGRYELEEFLIKKYRPLLNRKDNFDD